MHTHLRILSTVMSNKTSQVADTVAGHNIDDETYYNLVQIARHTKYSNPVGAAVTAGKVFRVIRDGNGNILKAWEVSKPPMNHTQTLGAYFDAGIAQAVANGINAQPKPCKVFPCRNGDEYEVRPVASVSRQDFNSLYAILLPVEAAVLQLLKVEGAQE